MAMTLAAARVNKGLTQKQAAEMLGISESTLISFEKSRSFPDVPMIKKITELYGTSYDDIDFFPEEITV